MLTLKISALAIVAEKQLSTASTPGANVCPQNDQQSPADPEPDELDECLEEVAHVITCLYKFSIAIQNPAPSKVIPYWCFTFRALRYSARFQQISRRGTVLSEASRMVEHEATPAA